MGTSAVWMARKRQRARDAGLCSRCCKVKPPVGYAVCKPCKTTTIELRRLQRQRAKASLKSLQLTAAHEQAGDSGRDEHLYEVAAQHYKLALDSSAITDNDRDRLEEKLTHALFFGPNPQAADPWIDRLLARNPKDPEKVVDLLFQKNRQLWTSANGLEQVALLTRAIRVAEATNDTLLIHLTKLRAGFALHNLGRIDLLEEYLDEIGELTEQSDARVKRRYYTLRAMLFAQRGNRSETQACFDVAVRLAQEGDDRLELAAVWSDYADWICALGDIEHAKTYKERALLTARSTQIGWFIPYMCLSYAGILRKMGQLQAAKDCVDEALGFGAFAPQPGAYLAEIGIPIALLLKDEDTLARCSQTKYLESAFQSGSPLLVGPTSAAFAEMYGSRGKREEARKLLHRALPFVRHVDQSWDFAIAVARYGVYGDLSAVRALLEQRAALPNPDVAAAFLYLFDAFVAQRKRNTRAMHARAAEAKKRFEALQWHAYADRAHALLPGSPPIEVHLRNSVSEIRLHPSLTAREHEIAALVVKGETNRAIAQKLSISKRTVETHLASIMARLGIRSRYQLPEALPE